MIELPLAIPLSDDEPLVGALFRTAFINNGDVTVAVVDRAPRVSWTPYKQVQASWPIAKLKYTDLSDVWTRHTEWKRL